MRVNKLYKGLKHLQGVDVCILLVYVLYVEIYTVSVYGRKALENTEAVRPPCFQESTNLKNIFYLDDTFFFLQNKPAKYFLKALLQN